jgi:hypothetical protein
LVALVVLVDAVQMVMYRSHVLLDAENLYLPQMFRPPVAIRIADVTWIGLLYQPVRPQSSAGWRSWMVTTDGQQILLIPAFYSRPTRPKRDGGAEGYAAAVRASLPGQFVVELWTCLNDAQGALGALRTSDASPEAESGCRQFWSAAPGTLVKRFGTTR